MAGAAWCARSGRPCGRGVERLWPHDLLELEDISGDWFRWLRKSGGRRGSVVIVRPDGFVFAATPEERLAEAIGQWRKQLGEPAAPARADARETAAVAVDCRRAA